MSATGEAARQDFDDAAPDAVDGFATFTFADTALAFLLAPAVPATVVAVAVAVGTLCHDGAAGAFMAFWLVFFALALGGYASALVIGVPAYLLIRARSRIIPPAAAMLTGGMVAASPWTVLAIAAREQALLFVAIAVFVLGCIGGISFSWIRDGNPWKGRL